MNTFQHKAAYLLAPILVHFFLMTGLAACTSIERKIFSDDYVTNPVSPDKVRTVSDQGVVSDCRKLALLRAKGEQPEEKMLKKLRKAAGKLGANTLLIMQSRRTTLKDVVEGIPQAAAAGALGIDANSPPAQTVEAEAYFCADLD